MFFQLPQIEKIQSSIANLQDQKQTLDNKALDAYSSEPNKVQNCLTNILNQVLSENQQCLEILKRIQDEVDMGFFIPSEVNIEDLVYQKNQLPDWFEFVFKKQYDKQKGNLDVLAKKIFKMQALGQIKANIQREAQSFRLLTERYQSLTQKQRASLNIMCEAELIRTKSKGCKQKYSDFCQTIATKILSFLEQSVSKSLNFSNSMNTIGSNASKAFQITKGDNRINRFEDTFVQNKFKQTLPTFQTNSYLPMDRMNFDKRSVRSGNQFYGRSQEFARSSVTNGFRNQASRFVPRHIGDFQSRFQHPGGHNNTLYDFYQ